MNRLQDWPSRLYVEIQKWRLAPFVWGGHDCCLFALRCVDAQTGLALADDFAGHYASKSGAVKVLRMTAHGGIEAAADVIAARHSFAPVPILRAGRGDVVSASTPLGRAIGVVDFDGMAALFAAPAGLQRLELKSCRRAWHV